MKKLLLVSTLLGLLTLSATPMVLAQVAREQVPFTQSESNSAAPYPIDPNYLIDAGDLKISCERVTADLLQPCLESGITPREIVDENGNTIGGVVQYDNAQ